VKKIRQTPSHARATAAAAFLLALSALLPASAQTTAGYASLSEIKDRRRAALIVSRVQTVDARDPTRAVLEGYRRALDGDPPRPHAAGHRLAARRLNKYIRSRRSLTAVETVADSDFVIFFNVVRARRSFMPDEPYVFGKLFVIAHPAREGAPPRIVWESEGEDASVEDAIGDFLKALMTARGER
jgi:hypothetical protein